MPGQQTIYIELLNEAVQCWRPVVAAHLNDDLYLIPHGAPIPEGEQWAFRPGQVVRCRQQVFACGETALAAAEAVPMVLSDAVAGLPLPLGQIADFCRHWSVETFSLFGSVLRSDFGPSSDVDVLVSFRADAHPTLFSIAQMTEELECMFDRPVDLVERRSVEQSENPVRRRAVLDSARVLYAA